ncbi:hypothetical protein MFRU_052g00360 [Monilinia fructicola]|nr:hypothetical protein MFRU_052g00360 [Monilinia fructicola]
MVINSLELNIQLIIPLLFSTQVFAAIGDNTEVQYRSEELFTRKRVVIIDYMGYRVTVDSMNDSHKTSVKMTLTELLWSE